MSTTIPAPLPVARLIEEWERQQSTYIPRREERFAVMLDIVEHLAPTTAPTILDLGTGPGSLAVRAAQRFPDATVVALDHDPYLLRMAEQRLTGLDPAVAARIHLARVDLRAPDRLAGLLQDLDLPALPTVAVSTTALHWLHPADLTGLMAALAGLLGTDGLYVNGDHLADRRDPARFDGLFTAVNDRSRARWEAQGAMDWEAWWAAAAEAGEWPEELAERTRWRQERDPSPEATLDHHLASLDAVGFDAAPVWRYFDDVVVAAVRR